MTPRKSVQQKVQRKKRRKVNRTLEHRRSVSPVIVGCISSLSSFYFCFPSPLPCRRQYLWCLWLGLVRRWNPKSTPGELDSAVQGSSLEHRRGIFGCRVRKSAFMVVDRVRSRFPLCRSCLRLFRCRRVRLGNMLYPLFPLWDKQQWPQWTGV